MFLTTCSFKDIRYMQYISAIIATLTTFSTSAYTSWPSPSLPKLTSLESPVGVITGEQASWIVSSPAIGALIVACIKTCFAEVFGRKTWLLISGLFLIVPAVIIYFSKLVFFIYVARFVLGMASALVYTTAPVYIAEISEKDIRGKLSVLLGIAGLCGNVFVLTIGPFLSYHTLALCCMVAPSLFLALFCFMPESPYYLIASGQKKKAFQSLITLSNKDADDMFINNRLIEIEENVTHHLNNKNNLWEFLSNKKHRMSIAIALGAKGIYLLSGGNVLPAYAQTIINKTDSIISPEMSSVLFGAIQIPTAILSSFLVDKAGRRPLWIVSTLGCTIALFGEGLYFHLHNTDFLEWLPTGSLLLYYVMCPIGVSTLPSVIAGEIFSNDIRSVAVSACVIYSSVLSFIVTKSYEPLATQIGIHFVFWIFAACCLSGAFFIFFVVPETKGKTLEEIQMMLNKSRKSPT